MKKTTITLLAIVSLAGLSTAALAERGGPLGQFGMGPGFPGSGLMLEHMADHLDLDDTQRESVRNIFEAAKPEIEALRDQMRANREALEALDLSDAAYSTELNNIAISNGELATQGTLLFTRIRSEVHAVLTDEQIAKLQRSKDRMKQRFKERRQRS
ncbi:MAG: Spy/CpxP family protein refolding chaperone [Woeseiaceae bacterium]|nr:Spy/CpxP family protein refolding chaperone [Woeseiaceae bacterium]